MSTLEATDEIDKVLQFPQEQNPKWQVRVCSKRLVSKDGERLKIPTLPSEMVVEILSKLPIKALHVCKCVSKTWSCLASEILDSKRSLQLPAHGLVFTLAVGNCKVQDPHFDITKSKFYYTYLSLVDGQTSMRIAHQNQDDGGVSSRAPFKLTDDRSGSLLEGLTLDFGKLGEIPEEHSWSMHKGLLLTIPDGQTCHVCNPVTKQVVVLPRSPLIEETDQPSELDRRAAIINLSDSSFPAECHFMVVKFSLRRKQSWIEVYYCSKHEWVLNRLGFRTWTASADWSLTNVVFLNNTMYFLTSETHMRKVKFTSDLAKVRYYYAVKLPSTIARGYHQSVIGESQGCLYLAHHKHISAEIAIWKCSECDHWTSVLQFRKYRVRCSRPFIGKAIANFLRNRRRPRPLGFDPNSSVVFLLVRPSVFACDLLNDTVTKVADFKDEEAFKDYFIAPYSPCLAPLPH